MTENDWIGVLMLLCLFLLAWALDDYMVSHAHGYLVVCYDGGVNIFNSTYKYQGFLNNWLGSSHFDSDGNTVNCAGSTKVIELKEYNRNLD